MSICGSSITLTFIFAMMSFGSFFCVIAIHSKTIFSKEAAVKDQNAEKASLLQDIEELLRSHKRVLIMMLCVAYTIFPCFYILGFLQVIKQDILLTGYMVTGTVFKMIFCHVMVDIRLSIQAGHTTLVHTELALAEQTMEISMMELRGMVSNVAHDLKTVS